jgi:hypothetical protein
MKDERLELLCHAVREFLDDASYTVSASVEEDLLGALDDAEECREAPRLGR